MGTHGIRPRKPVQQPSIFVLCDAVREAIRIYDRSNDHIPHSPGEDLNFLTLRPGDTDASYFADYTDAQRAFCAHHAEVLACETLNRFGEG